MNFKGLLRAAIKAVEVYEEHKDEIKPIVKKVTGKNKKKNKPPEPNQ